MPMDNDTRGWILTAISGVACVLGAGFICIDIIVRLFPGKKGFKIQDSNGFLSCSLSLSAGVMLFSSLYKLLPESKSSFTRGGYSSRTSAWVLIACFLAGVWGIQIISRVLHLLMPSHVVGCDHTHDDDDTENQKQHEPYHSGGPGTLETTPLLSRPTDVDEPDARRNSNTTPEMRAVRAPIPLRMNTFRPSLPNRMSRKMTAIVTGGDSFCDQDGPCKGYTSPCGVECFRNISARGGTRAGSQSLASRPTLRRAASTTLKNTAIIDAHSHAQNPHTHSQNHDAFSDIQKSSLPTTRSPSPGASSYLSSDAAPAPTSQPVSDSEVPAHHHHVPQNAFLSLSYQTSVAIVLHKLPEGFITYASNHANPSLGFNVFMALAIHNITEGFALALPIYLATNSRSRALLYSFVLGGFSQPLGAAVAAVWLKIAERGKGDYAPSQGVYGGLFAATAGILANVALNLLSQSFELSHNKGLCMFFVFVGMGVLGVSSALTA